MNKLTLEQLSLKNHTVLVRVDFNVPLTPDGTITDLTRIKAALPTIEYILKEGGIPILMSHLGRPDHGFDPALSLAPCAKALQELLHIPVQMAPDCIGAQVTQIVNSLKQGDILVLENLRFHAAEEKPQLDPSFAQQLSSLGTLYINDAFGSAHRAHSSTVTITQYFPNKAAAGYLMQKEIASLNSLLIDPQHPFFAIIGGSKISSKISTILSLLSHIDALFIGGAMAFTFLKALGKSIGSSLYEEKHLTTALELIQACQAKKIPLHLPLDVIATDCLTSTTAKSQCIDMEKGIPEKWQGVDIGPNTIYSWQQLLQQAATVFWNGPVGVFEIPNFSLGTRTIAETLSHLHATTIVGGGDSVAAVTQLHLENYFTHLSTGGGASLEYIEKGSLPGINALSSVSGLLQK